jgi:hypothetical protein
MRQYLEHDIKQSVYVISYQLIVNKTVTTRTVLTLVSVINYVTSYANPC